MRVQFNLYMIRFGFIFFIAGLLFFSCKEDAKTTSEGSSMLVKEIQLRLNDFEKEADSLKTKGIDPNAIHTRFQELLLVSKDVENLQASVNMHKALLDEICSTHQLNRSQLLEINSSMSLEQIDLILKQNELQLFNQIWMNKLSRNVELKTAH